MTPDPVSPYGIPSFNSFKSFDGIKSSGRLTSETFCANSPSLHGPNAPFPSHPSSSRNSPRLSSTGRSVTEKIIAGSLFEVFLK